MTEPASCMAGLPGTFPRRHDGCSAPFRSWMFRVATSSRLVFFGNRSTITRLRRAFSRQLQVPLRQVRLRPALWIAPAVVVLLEGPRLAGGDCRSVSSQKRHVRSP